LFKLPSFDCVAVCTEDLILLRILEDVSEIAVSASKLSLFFVTTTFDVVNLQCAYVCEPTRLTNCSKYFEDFTT
jgi:hypothetical protein